MKYFITGISGFIGSSLARQLAADGHTVNSLIRGGIPPELKEETGIRFFKGDLFDRDTMIEAMQGCEVAFHLAALTKPWARDPGDFRRINVDGAVNVFDAALKAGIRRVVFTSSAATMSPSEEFQAVSEQTPRHVPFFNAYEVTKTDAEMMAREFCRKGIEVVTVNPSRVYGPGPLNPSNSVTRMIAGYEKGNWRIIPGDGKKVGNYVFIDDVVHGHILASQYGRPGERYILGGENLTFDQFFHALESITGKKYRMVHLPLGLMKFAACCLEIQNRITGIPPLITADWVKKYLNHWCLSSDKAIRELGYRITPFEKGVERTLTWLRA